MIEWLWPWVALLAPLPWLVRRLAPPAHSQDPALRSLIPFAPKARRLSGRMQRAWLEFAKSGDPGHDDLPDGAPYDGSGATMRLAPHCRSRR